MDEIKVENFLKENPERRFPVWRALRPAETRMIRHRLAERIGASREVEKSALTRLLLERATAVVARSALDAKFSVRETLRDLGVEWRPSVYLNWHQFDDVDEMTMDDLDDHFEHVWYPSSDDLDVFDESLSWILSISHDGEIQFYSL